MINKHAHKNINMQTSKGNEICFINTHKKTRNQKIPNDKKICDIIQLNMNKEARKQTRKELITKTNK